MSVQTVEIEAASLEEARRQIYNENYIVLEEFVICAGDVGIVESFGDTAEKAFIKAQSRVPADATIEKRNVSIAPAQFTLRVLGDDEKSVGKGQSELFTSVALIKKGRKGFLGFGKSTNIYEIVLNQRAVVEIRFRIPAKLRATIRDYSAQELLQSVQNARQLDDSQTEEILQLLNPKNDTEIRKKILKINELTPSAVFDFIEELCSRNEQANWQSIIEEAHLRVLIWRENELKKEKIRLRTLDVEIAESFHFYTSIDWYPNGKKEPTGLPRDVYGGHHYTDERLRQTIPKYSTDEAAFGKLARRIEAFGLYEFYKQTLLSAGLSETTATLEQKCLAALEAKKIKGKKAPDKEEKRNIILPDQNSLAKLKSELSAMCLGDQDKVNRLINFEKKQNPDVGEEQLYASAVERLRRDNE